MSNLYRISYNYAGSEELEVDYILSEGTDQNSVINRRFSTDFISDMHVLTFKLIKEDYVDEDY